MSALNIALISMKTIILMMMLTMMMMMIIILVMMMMVMMIIIMIRTKFCLRLWQRNCKFKLLQKLMRSDDQIAK